MMIVLVIYLLIVQDSLLTGVQSFVLILTCFVFGGALMIRGSYNRTKNQQEAFILKVLLVAPSQVIVATVYCRS